MTVGASETILAFLANLCITAPSSTHLSSFLPTTILNWGSLQKRAADADALMIDLDITLFNFKLSN